MMKPKRPLLIWVMGIIFFVAALGYFLRAAQTIHEWNLLLVIQYRFGPVYPLFQGLFLGASFLCGAFLLIRQISWAPLFNSITFLLAVIWNWLDRTLLSQAPQPFNQEIFSIIATLILIFIIVGGLWSLQPYMQAANRDERGNEPTSFNGGGTDEHQST